MTPLPAGHGSSTRMLPGIGRARVGDPVNAQPVAALHIILGLEVLLQRLPDFPGHPDVAGQPVHRLMMDSSQNMFARGRLLTPLSSRGGHPRPRIPLTRAGRPGLPISDWVWSIRGLNSRPSDVQIRRWSQKHLPSGRATLRTPILLVLLAFWRA